MTEERHAGVHMTDEELERVRPAEELFPSPVPTQIVSNGEYNPLEQTIDQKRVEAMVKEMADERSKRLNMSRRNFLATASGMAVSFAAMNAVYGDVFSVADAHTTDIDAAEDRAKGLEGQFIFDAQTHFVRDDFKQEGLSGLRQWAIDMGVNKALGEDGAQLIKYKFDNYVKEMFFDSDTKAAIISGAVFDDPTWNLVGNDSIQDACKAVNKFAGTTRLMGHSVIEPSKDGWMDEVDRAIEVLKPVSWKTYTIGDPFGPSQYSWRLDDEKLVYPFYEKAQKAGINTICVHKGLMPLDYEKKFKGTWESATVNDLGQAAKDWPGLNFVIYHSALRPYLMHSPEAEMAEFEKSGYIRWSTDLARIPEKYDVNNVWAEIGTSFASSCVTNPRFCAAFVGQLVNEMGPDRVVWGTDSVWYGSPQWQIEAMRRMEIPEDMMKKMGWKTPLGDANGEVKRKIFGLNSSQIYKLKMDFGQIDKYETDNLALAKAEYRKTGTMRSNNAYGYAAMSG